jgi:ABC-2 type transport system permease protein
MSASVVGRQPSRGSGGGIPIVRRLYGLGSVFGKTLRDSRLGALGVAAFVGLTLLGGGSAMAGAYATPGARAEMAAYTAQIPAAMRVMYGNPVNVGTLGGFLSWHYSGMFALIAGLWSILALSSTLAGDLRRGSLEFVLAAPLSRRRLALEKVAAHIAAMTAAMAVVALAAWLTGALSGGMPGDAIPPEAAIAFAVKTGLMALLAGAVAFALAPFLGNRSAAGLAGAVMLGSYVVHGYESAIPAFRSISGLTWFSWAESHLPLAGAYDWPSQLALAVAIVVLLAIGVEAFVRRDVVVAGGLPVPGLPGALLGLQGALGRSFAEQFPTSLAWGFGMGAFGFVVAAASRSFTEEIWRVPEIVRLVNQIFPGVDIATPGGFLELVFVEFGFVLVGLAAATFVAGWASDETSGRLEMILSTPLSRARSEIAGGLAACLAIALAVALLAASIAAGAAVAGGDAATPAAGTIVLGLYAAALAGIGFAIGGAARPSIAGPAVALLAIATFVIDLLAPALNLPDWVHQLALSAHLGQPMVGRWDGAGMAACLALAVAGMAAGAWGMRRRDVNT